LLLSGAIQDIACVGGVCVGRSVQAVRQNITQPLAQGIQRGVHVARHRTPLKQIRSLFRCR
jgi:hypothetical protein